MAEQAVDMSREEVKKLEGVAHTYEATHHLVESLQAEFRESPEGRLAAYLQTEIIDSALKSNGRFLESFAVGRPGQRGVHNVITFLKKGSEKIAKDEDLAEELKKIAKKMESANLPDKEKMEHFSGLIQSLDKLKLTSDLHSFMREFNSILVSAVKYPDTEVAKIVKSRSPKKMAKILMLENFELNLIALKFIYSRLFRPDEKAQAAAVLHGASFDGLEVKIAQRTGLSEAAVRHGIAICLPEEHEIETPTGMKNLGAFANDIVENRDKNVFVKFFLVTGNKSLATKMLTMFGSKGKVVTDPKTARNFAGAIINRERENVKEKVEHDAKDELFNLVAATLRDMEERTDAVRKKFVNAIEGRISELEKQHDKRLAKAKKIDKELKSSARQLYLFEDLSADDSEEIRKIGATEYEYLRRAEDITKVLEARLVVQRCLLGDFDTTMARSRLDSIMASGPSPFAAKAIRQMTSLLEAVKNGGMPADEFKRFMGHIDRFIDSLKTQIPHIIGFLKQAEERKKMRMEEHDLLQNEARYHLDSSDREARRRLEELRKLGIDVGRYHENMSSEDEDVLEDYE